ncbi:crotonase/enoyl-CoA hydratase family protein [Arenibaculum sp.]|jgi:DSF synthase|uniref:crotonase/enoyl-CoA hydratase family protein n=1 Tax=Arenibaculum sp. TaxID=2865862 RepID=UPI002E159866|nr:crotonase/enoyl-CoA hydratase family protein [Arenibaculum sp.]
MSAVTQLFEDAAIPGRTGRLDGIRPQFPSLAETAPPLDRVADMIAAASFQDLAVEFDRNDRILWCDFRFKNRPCFTEAMLHDFARVRVLMQSVHAAVPEIASPVRYVALRSPMPGTWNLGGDLNLFAELIRLRDRERLTRYAIAAAESGYHYTTSFGLPLTTVSLVQGDALGGGFEAALSSNLLIAERSAKFGLPEILFNMFPGMGAYTFLARRIGAGLAERMITSGSVYGAEELHAMGVIDVLAEDGGAVDAFHEHIGRAGSRFAAHRAIQDVRRIVNPITLREMHEVAHVWVDLALRLEDADLRKMARLVAAQDRRRARQASS